MVRRNIAYGDHPAQRFDVYAPEQARGAPVLLMVHGGAWIAGDKDAERIIANKLARWLPRGFVFVIVNYRLLPEAGPLDQARDVAYALAAAQEQAATWGADRSKFILIGHSAGAHLLALLAAQPELAAAAAARPWLGTILLDSGALDVPAIMKERHLALYDRAFGKNPAYWQAVSPYHQLRRETAPLLAVCSSRRSDACPQARQFAARAEALGSRAVVLEQDLSHTDLNQQLGDDTRYTAAVEAFMRGLSRSVDRALR